MQIHQQVFFVLGLVVAVPMLVYYYRRGGHRRFRPKVGEMAMVSLFAVLGIGAGAMLLGSLLDDPDQYRVNEELSQAPPPDAGFVNAESGDGAEGDDRRRDRGRSRDGGRESNDTRRDSGRGGKGADE
jgi:hypothetical protein